MGRTKLNETIKDRRKKIGLTQTELAELLKVGRSTIARYESGEISPSMENLVKLSMILRYDFVSEKVSDFELLKAIAESEASFEHQVIKELCLINDVLDSDDDEKQYHLIVTEGMKKFVVADDDIKEFCSRSKEYLKIAFKHFLLDKGAYNGEFGFDDEE